MLRPAPVKWPAGGGEGGAGSQDVLKGEGFVFSSCLGPHVERWSSAICPV